MKCECGCGMEVKPGNKFINHHNGRCRSEETRQKLSIAGRGRTVSKETREKIGKFNKGKFVSEETREKQRQNMKGNKYFEGHNHSDETKKKLSESKTGRIVSEETRDKLRKANLGKKSSDETKRKLSIAGTGRKHTEESKKKMSDHGKGKIIPDEARRNMSIAARGRIVSEETRKKLSGENSSNWKGGISFEPYCPKFNNKFKEEIREMFNRNCFLCGISEEDENRKLSIHHVTYDKSCLCDDVVCKFVPLCIKCHAKTNYNRDYWEKLILSKLEVF